MVQAALWDSAQGLDVDSCGAERTPVHEATRFNEPIKPRLTAEPMNEVSAGSWGELGLGGRVWRQTLQEAEETVGP